MKRLLELSEKDGPSLIIREILRGNTQFNRFMENIEGISPKGPTERLRELEQLGIIGEELYQSIHLG